MKKKINNLIAWLYLALAILTLFVATVIDTTSDDGFKVAVPICFVCLIITMIAYCLNSKPNKSLNTVNKIVKDKAVTISAFKTGIWFNALKVLFIFFLL